MLRVVFFRLSHKLPSLKRNIVGCALGAALMLCISMHAFAQHYQQINLVSDVPGMAPVTDANLVNPWGLASSSSSPWWVADNGTGVSTLYNGAGQKINLTVTIPPPAGGTPPSAPTGIVFNGNSSDFGGARFIFATEDGTISAWIPSVDQFNAILKVDHSSTAIYKGLTLASFGGANYLYAANFHGGVVEVFDKNFNPFSFSPTAFTDSGIPAGYAPFNVQAIGSAIVVTFAKQDKDKEDEVAGNGFGFVDVFTPNGVLVMRLQQGSWMNAP